MQHALKVSNLFTIYLDFKDQQHVSAISYFFCRLVSSFLLQQATLQLPSILEQRFKFFILALALVLILV